MGTASLTGDIVLELSTTEPLQLLPDLLPNFLVILMGTFMAGTDGRISIKVTCTAESSIPLFDLLGDASPIFGLQLS